MPDPANPMFPPLYSGRVRLFASASALFLLLLLCVSFAGIYALSGVRGYVLGEGLWSKAQKRSVIALHRYAVTGDERQYEVFHSEIAITRGDRRAREELDRPNPDMAVVREGFLEGQLPEEAIPAMARLFRWGRDLGFVDRSISIWEEGDRMIDGLELLAHDLHAELEADEPDPERVLVLLDRIGEVDDELTVLEDEFSRTFNAGAAQVERALFLALALLAVALAVAGVVGIRFFLRQIRRRDEAHRASERKYRELFERNVVGVLVASTDGRILEVNTAFARVLGFDSASEIRGMVVDDFLEATSSEMGEWEEPREVRARAKGGERRHLLVASAPVGHPDDGEERLLVTATDVTERHSLEERLARARKMEAMGQLAGGVAHDFNNLLTVILGHAAILQADLNKVDGVDESTDESVAEILRTSQTAAGLTRQLLTFSRSRVMEQRVLDLNESVKGARSLFMRLLPSSIECRIELSESVEPVKLSPVHLEQLLLNMSINARDAMEGGGVLTIRTAMRSISEGPQQRRLGIVPGSYVTLEVEDTGHGMDAGTVARIFEPFFTTKEQERGTGMGLATVYGIVTQAGGTVDVRSTPGVGTVFVVYLPPASSETTPSSGASGSTGSTGTTGVSGGPGANGAS